MGADLEALISRYVDPRVAARVAAMDSAIVFVNFHGQRAAISKVHRGAPPIAGVTVDGAFWGRHFLYNVPQSVAWREPPLMTQLSTLRDWGVAVNPHRHFVRPSLADLATYMWEACGAGPGEPADKWTDGAPSLGDGAPSLDVFVGTPTALDSAFLFELTAPLEVVTAVVYDVKWRALEPSPSQPFTRPVQYTNTVHAYLMGSRDGAGAQGEGREGAAMGEEGAAEPEEWVIRDVAHALVASSGVGPGAVVRLVVDSHAVVPEPCILDVVRPVEPPALPDQFQWVGQRCCLPDDMEAAMEARHCCRRLGLPSNVSLQTFYSLGSTQLACVFRSPVVWGDAPVSPSLADIMHCSSAFAPEWGHLRLHLLVHACGVDDFLGLVAEDCPVASGDRLFLRQRWAAFEAFLTRHRMWSAATAFDVVPVSSGKSKRRRKGRVDKGSGRRCKGKGVPIHGRLSATIQHLSTKPHPSPPEELATAP